MQPSLLITSTSWTVGAQAS